MFLDDSDAHPRVKERMALTERLIAPNAAASFRLETRGETTIERVISLVLLGDLVSIYLATLRGVDPGPVHVIEQLKAALRALRRTGGVIPSGPVEERCDGLGSATLDLPLQQGRSPDRQEVSSCQ